MAVSLRETKILVATMLLGVASYIGCDIHLASLPFIAIYMHTTKLIVQQSVPLYILGMGVSVLIYGPLSDKVGRKPLIIFGLSFAALFSFIGADTTHIGPFLMARVFQGFGAGACIAMGRTIMVDTVQGERMASMAAYFSLFSSISPMLAPAMGGYLQKDFGWQANFIALGGFLLALMLLFLFFLPETNTHRNPHAMKVASIVENYTALFKHHMFVGCMFIAGFTMAANIAYNTVSSFIFQKQFMLGPVIFGWVTAITTVGNIVGKLFVPYFIKRIGGLRTLFLGVCLSMFSGAALTLFALFHFVTVAVIIGAVLIIMMAQALIMPNTTSQALSPFHHMRGLAASLYGGFQLLLAFLTSTIVGGLAYEGIAMLGSTFLILGLLNIAVYSLTIGRKKIKAIWQ